VQDYPKHHMFVMGVNQEVDAENKGGHIMLEKLMNHIKNL